MKQIFDWMRKKPLKAFEVYDGSIGVYPCEVNRLIDEAEAKRESEVCEWKQEKILEFSLSDCVTSCGHTEHYSVGVDKYCRHCGKPIKISEVE